MYRKFKGILLITLCFVLVIGSVASSFAVGTGKIASLTSVLTKGKPVNTPPANALVTVQGTVKVSLVQSRHLTLISADNKLYNLIGKISGLEKYIDKQVVIKGRVITDVISIGEKGILLEVTNFKPLPSDVPSVKPTPILPTPIQATVVPSSKIIMPYEKLEGVLKVSKSDEPIISSAEVPYRFELETGAGLYMLQGKIEGLENYNGLKVEVSGTVSPLKIYPPIFIVESYKIISEPVPTPAYDVIKGTVKIVKVVPSTDIVVEEPYKYQLVTESGLFDLIGNTKGLEQYDGQVVELKGYYVKTLIAQYPPMFNVVSYSPILSTPPDNSMTHSILSDKPLYFTSPKEGEMKVLDGKCAISWSDNTNKAFFRAALVVLKDTQKYDYVFELSAVKTSDKDSITGLFNIMQDGNVIVKEIPGKIYGLGQPAGSYFKFYSDDSQWHMSAYIADRLDF